LRRKGATQVSGLEAVTAQVADKKLRAETAAKIDAMAVDLVKAGAAFDAGAAQLTASATASRLSSSMQTGRQRSQ